MENGFGDPHTREFDLLLFLQSCLALKIKVVGIVKSVPTAFSRRMEMAVCETCGCRYGLLGLNRPATFSSECPSCRRGDDEPKSIITPSGIDQGKTIRGRKVYWIPDGYDDP